MLLSEAIHKFEAWRAERRPNTKGDSYAHHLWIYCICRDNPELESITLDDVTEYFRRWRVHKSSDRSYSLRHLSFKKFFEFFTEQGYKVPSPKLILVPPPEFYIPRVATEEEYKKLVHYIKGRTHTITLPPKIRKKVPRDKWQRVIKDHRHVRNLAIIGLLHDTGMRVEELVSLKVDQVDLRNRCAIIKTAKIRSRHSRPFRYVFWSRQVNNWLRDWLQDREIFIKRQRRWNKNYSQDALFLNITGQLHGNPIRTIGVQYMLRSYSRKLGIWPTLNAHSWRHQLAHDVLDNGGDLIGVKEVLGHSSILSSQVYLKLNKEEIQKYWRLARENKMQVRDLNKLAMRPKNVELNSWMYNQVLRQRSKLST